jgi:hypothetical protein
MREYRNFTGILTLEVLLFSDLNYNTFSRKFLIKLNIFSNKNRAIKLIILTAGPEEIPYEISREPDSGHDLRITCSVSSYPL